MHCKTVTLCLLPCNCSPPTQLRNTKCASKHFETCHFDTTALPCPPSTPSVCCLKTTTILQFCLDTLPRYARVNATLPASWLSLPALCTAALSTSFAAAVCGALAVWCPLPLPVGACRAAPSAAPCATLPAAPGSLRQSVGSVRAGFGIACWCGLRRPSRCLTPRSRACRTWQHLKLPSTCCCGACRTWQHLKLPSTSCCGACTPIQPGRHVPADWQS